MAEIPDGLETLGFKGLKDKYKSITGKPVPNGWSSTNRIKSEIRKLLSGEIGSTKPDICGLYSDI